MSTSLETAQASSPQKSWLTMALLYGLPMGLFFSFQSGNYMIGLPIGLVAGALFSSLMSGFVSRQTRRFKTESPDFGSEASLHDGPANHFSDLESVGGHLWLTSGQLHFRSHKMNLQNHEWSVPLADIVSAEATKTLGLISNGLRVNMSSGEVHRFIVNDNKRWAQAILTARQSLAE
jgi:hypothetical protein